MEEAHLEVPRSARYFTLGGGVDPLAETWYVCHGYRQLANRFLRRFDGIATSERLIVAPEGLSRFYLEGDGREHTQGDRVGATWMTREDRETEIRDYVRYLDLLQAHIEKLQAPTEGSRCVVLGFSQGVHTVCRWLASGQVSPEHLVLWGAYPPGDLPEGAVERMNRTRITVVRGKNDPHVTDSKHADQTERMRALGFRFDVLEHPEAHQLHSPTLAALTS